MATDYLVPTSIDEALAALDPGAPWRILAGGTDVYPGHVGREVPARVIDITRIPDLRGITSTTDPDGRRWIRLGACTTWTDIVRAPLGHGLAALQIAARQVGAVQVQNTGTIAGNICTASPAGDGIAALVGLDAHVEVRSRAATRRLPIDEFVVGYRATDLGTDELVTAILLPEPGPRMRSTFVKFGTREYLVISLAMVAARIDRNDDGSISDVRIAVGACSPVARRLPEAEARVMGLTPNSAPIEITAADCDGLTPIDDIRCSAEYRRRLVPELVARALRECGVNVR